MLFLSEMLMFTKIKNLFLPKENNQENKESQKIKRKIIADNSVLMESQLINAIIIVLKPLRLKKQEIKQLTLYVHESENDLAVTTLANTKTFEEKLYTALENNGIDPALQSRWFCKKEQAPSDAIELDNGIYLIYSFVIEIPQTKVRITPLQGILEEDNYILEFEPDKRYNIGRGEKPQLDNGMIHKNQIIIKELDGFQDGNDDDYMEYNRYVSRKHAYFIASGKGFALKVYSGGCYLEGNRTRILREHSEPIDVQNPEIAYPLKHEDQIELGKKVILLFEII